MSEESHSSLTPHGFQLLLIILSSFALLFYDGLIVAVLQTRGTDGGQQESIRRKI